MLSLQVRVNLPPALPCLLCDLSPPVRPTSLIRFNRSIYSISLSVDDVWRNSTGEPNRKQNDADTGGRRYGDCKDLMQ